MSGAMNRGYSFPERTGTKTGETSTGSSTAGIIDTAQQSAKDLGSTVASKAEEAWDTSKRTAQEFASSAATKAEDVFQTVGDFIGRYPVYAMLFAFGVGFMVAEVFRGFPRRESTDYSSRR
jgi:ElaB/YqjD/DUF883 family membrane-anchored ribosome-binding protein